MSPQLSPHNKAVLAGAGAVVLAAITAWQAVGAHGLPSLVQLLPVAVAALAAAQNVLIPNLPESPYAKTIVQCCSVVVGAMATAVANDGAGVDAAKLLTIGATAFLVWWVPEAPHPLVDPNPPPDPTPPKHSADLTPTAEVPVVSAVPPVTPASPPPAAAVPSA